MIPTVSDRMLRWAGKAGYVPSNKYGYGLGLVQVTVWLGKAIVASAKQRCVSRSIPPTQPVLCEQSAGDGIALLRPAATGERYREATVRQTLSRTLPGNVASVLESASQRPEAAGSAVSGCLRPVATTAGLLWPPVASCGPARPKCSSASAGGTGFAVNGHGCAATFPRRRLVDR